MQDKICLITGGSAGIGKATALGLAEQGAMVIIVCRNEKRGQATLDEIKRSAGNDSVSLMPADLSSQAEVRRLVQEFQANYPRLDVLINNAGIVMHSRELTVDGVEMTLAVNHLASFLLTNLLLDSLKAAETARIINVSSQVHSQTINFDNLQGEQRFYGLEPYNQSKLANILFTYELARRLAGTEITVNCLHPGVVSTKLLSDFSHAHHNPTGGRLKSLRHRLRPKKADGITPEEGAKTSLYLATSTEVAGVSGKYFRECRQAKSAPISYDEEVAQKLWAISAELTSQQKEIPKPVVEASTITS